MGTSGCEAGTAVPSQGLVILSEAKNLCIRTVHSLVLLLYENVLCLFDTGWMHRKQPLGF
jgi:hypothetical protein